MLRLRQALVVRVREMQPSSETAGFRLESQWHHVLNVKHLSQPSVQIPRKPRDTCLRAQESHCLE